MSNKLLLIIIFTLLSPTLKAQVSWGGVDYKGKPWVSNTSLPYTITNGLAGRHLAVWASHGRYYSEEDLPSCIESVAAALQTLCLAAYDKGISTCWVEEFKTRKEAISWLDN